MSANELKIGTRVEIPPHLDAWMRGDRYGVVESHLLLPRKRIAANPTPAARVRLDKSGRVVVLRADSLTVIS